MVHRGWTPPPNHAVLQSISWFTSDTVSKEKRLGEGMYLHVSRCFVLTAFEFEGCMYFSCTHFV